MRKTTTTIAKRYAKALFKEALRVDGLSATIDDMRRLEVLLRQEKSLACLLTNPIFPKKQVQSALMKILEKLDFGDTTKGLVSVLCKNRRLFALGPVIEEFYSLNLQHRNIVLAKVTSVIDFSEKQKAAIITAIGKYLGCGVEAEYAIDKALLRGVRVKVGSMLFDASLATKLKNLKIQMKVA